MTQCSKHHDQKYKFQCEKCKIYLCSKCSPVSFRGSIYCCECCEQVENAIYQKTVRKQSAIHSPSMKILLVVFLFLSVFGTTSYFFYFKPREIAIPSDDRERLCFYLDLAYDSSRDSPTFKRQMKNILRLNMSYRHLITYLKKGEKHFDQGQYEQAIESFSKVKTMVPDWAYIYILMAECYNKNNNFEQAKEEMIQSIELNPDSPKSYLYFGKIYADNEEFEKAILQYTKALYLDNRNKDILLHLAKLYIKKNRFIKAREFRNKAKDLGANTKEIDLLIKKRLIK